MTIKIGSNIASLGAQRRIAEATSTLGKVYERLSSGQRINSASDDAAGLAIATQLNSDTRVFTQAIRNVNDGLSFLSIADQALQQLSSITTRQRELAEQAANGSLSLAQRRSLDAEATQLTNEYNRILETSKFNGQTIFGTSGTQLTIQAGAGEQATLSIDIGAKMSGANAASSTNLSVSSNATAETTQINFNAGSFANFSASFADATIQNGTYEISQIIVGAGSSYSGGESFNLYTDPSTVNHYYFVVDGIGGGGTVPIFIDSAWDADTVAQAVATTIGGSTYSSTVIYTTATQEDTTDIFSFSGSIIVSTIQNGSTNIIQNYSGGEYYAFHNVYTGSTDYFWIRYEGAGSDPGLSGSGYVIDVTSSSTGADIANAIAAAYASTDYSVSTSSNSITFTNNYLVYDDAINYTNSASISIGNSNPGAGIANGSFFSFFPDGSNSFYLYFGPYDPAPYSNSIHVTNYRFTDANTLASTVTTQLNTQSGGTVTATNLGGGIVSFTNTSTGSTSDSGKSWNFSLPVTTTIQGTSSGIDVLNDRISYTSHGLTTGQRIQLTSTGGAPGGLSTGVDYYAIIVDANTFKLANSYSNALAGTAINITSTGTGSQTFTGYIAAGSSVALTASQIDLTSATSARTALTTLATRQQQIGLEIGAQGAFQSRLETALNNLYSMRENYSRSYATITSADIAQDSAALIRGQILQQAAASILSQANLAPQLALKLLR